MKRCHKKLGEKMVPDTFYLTAEAALQLALNGGKDRPHVNEGIAQLKEAIEHGKAGHADVATKHAETAVVHLSQGR
jgi:hypothetical protein